MEFLANQEAFHLRLPAAMLRFGALLSVAMMACSGPSIALSDLDQEMQQARCERLARCKLFPDEASCLTFFRVVSDPSVTAGVAAHKIDYNGERAKQCVDAIAKQSCDLTTRDSHIAPKACDEMMTGRVAGGDSCSVDAECASGTCNLPAMCPERACCVGTCRPTQPPGKTGAGCAKDHDCVDGLVCGQDLMCRSPGSAGAACNSDDECGDGLGCVGALSTTPGTCKALPHVGQACPYQRCAEENLRCDAATNMCVPVGLPGDPCPTSTECSSGMECDAATHLCREYPTLGMPCAGTCGGEAFCMLDNTGAGTCVSLLPNNTPCDGNQQCVSAFCEDGAVFRGCIDPYVCI